MSEVNPQQNHPTPEPAPQIIGVTVNRRKVMVDGELVEMPEKDQPKEPFPQ